MFSDYIQRFIFDDSDIRGAYVRLETSYQSILARQAYPVSVADLLGEFSAAAVLLSRSIKFDGLLSLQVRSQGPLSLMMAEANGAGGVRALAEISQSFLESGQAFPESGQGQDFLSFFSGGSGIAVAAKPAATMAITIEPQGGKRYQGIVPLDRADLAGCLERYFEQSEQLKTRIWLTAEAGRCGGLMLQEMPPQCLPDPVVRQARWQHLETLAQTLTRQELLDLPGEQLLYRLYHQEAVRLLDQQGVKFQCSCSRERTERALLTMGKAEAETALDEQSHIEMSCHFCGERYCFSAEQVRNLFMGTNGGKSH